MSKNKTINVDGVDIKIFTQREDDYFSITDIAKNFEVGVSSIESWLRNRNTVEFLGTWEKLYNPDFNSDGFDGIKMNVGLNTFKLSVKKWVGETNAIGLQAKAGKYGGTYAHKDIAIQFCYYLSPVFQLYLIKEFQRLKEVEAEQQADALNWNIRRTLAKINYKIHTDAIQENLIPSRVHRRPRMDGFVYASEADILNLALFEMTAKEWKIANPKKKGNMRDDATTEQLLVLANLETHNAQFIKEGLSQDERLEKLNEIAIYQMQLLVNMPQLKQLK
jgi:hypothetical protein